MPGTLRLKERMGFYAFKVGLECTLSICFTGQTKPFTCLLQLMVKTAYEVWLHLSLSVSDSKEYSTSVELRFYQTHLVSLEFDYMKLLTPL